MPGFLKTTQLYLKLSEDFRGCQKISKDVSINSEVLKVMIMLHTELQKSDISGKVLPFTHLEFLFLTLVEFTYFWKVSQLTL